MNGKKEINIVLGNNIRRVREQQKLTREAFAEKINVSARFLADVEKGVVGMSLSTLKESCLVLGVSADFLLNINQNDDSELDRLVLMNKVMSIDKRFVKNTLSIVEQLIEIEQYVNEDN